MGRIYARYALAAVSLILLASGSLMLATATAPALASSRPRPNGGPDVYTTNQAGYQLFGDLLRLRYAQATFTVPASTTGLGLVGITLTDYTTGVEAGCGENLGGIGCFDEATPDGWQLLIPPAFVSPGDVVMVTLHYYPATGKMKLHADDLTTGRTKTITDAGEYKNEQWSQVTDVINIDNATIPVPAKPLILSSFSNVYATTNAGKTITLTNGQPVIDTLTGTDSGAVVAGPAGLTGGKAFQVVEQPTA